MNSAFMAAQWFDALGPCLGCGRAATGTLKSHRNASLGPACARCAAKAIRKAHSKGGFHPDSAKGSG